MTLNRRDFIKLAVFSVINLSACKKGYKNKWVATGNKKIFNPGTHIIPIEEEYSYIKNEQINVPYGYSLFETEEIIDSFGKISKRTKTAGIKYIFINDAEIEALEYKYFNSRGEEEKIGYPFAGKTVQKVLTKEVK